MDAEQIALALYPLYSADAVHEATVALLERSTPPRNPMGFCRRVAQRAMVNEYRQHSTRDGAPRLLHSTGVGLGVRGDDDGDAETRDDRLFGVCEPLQLRRLEALETLETLHPVRIAVGLGYHDPPPTDPSGLPEQTRERQRYEERRKRRLRGSEPLGTSTRRRRTLDPGRLPRNPGPVSGGVTDRIDGGRRNDAERLYPTGRRAQAGV